MLRPRASADYDGASTGRRLGLWNPTGANINSILSGSGETLLRRSRDIVRRNAWASEIRAEWVANAVGTGIIPEFLHPAETVRRIFDEGWKRFADAADADGRCSIYGLQELACGEIIVGAESLTRLRPRRPGDGLLTPIQLQMMQAEMLPLMKNEPAANGNAIRCGIEFSPIHQRVAYHLYREHPGAGVTAIDEAPGLTVRVRAESIIHAYRMVENGQIRGEPMLARALARLYQFDQFVDATLARQRLGAFMLGWIKSSPPDEIGGPMNQTSTAPDGSAAPAGVRFGSIEPDTMMQLAHDEEIDFFKQPEISTQYEQFVAAQLREIFASAGMTLEMFDPSKVNFSSIRSGVLKYRRRCEQFQFNTLCFQFNRPVLNAWMDAFVLFGGAERIADRLGVERIKVADYLANRDLYQDVEWRTPTWQWVDPLKDVMAKVLQIRAGLLPLSAAIRELGYNPIEVFRQYAADKESLAEHGLVFDTDPAQVSKSGVAQDPASDPEEPPLNKQESALAKAFLQ